MLQCLKCFTQNEDDAKFCKECGKTVSPFAIETGNREQVVLTIIGFFLATVPFINYIIYELFGYGSMVGYLATFLNFLGACIPLLIAIFIKNMGVKVTLFILGGLLILRSLYFLIYGAMYY